MTNLRRRKYPDFQFKSRVLKPLEPTDYPLNPRNQMAIDCQENNGCLKSQDLKKIGVPQSCNSDWIVDWCVIRFTSLLEMNLIFWIQLFYFYENIFCIIPRWWILKFSKIFSLYGIIYTVLNAKEVIQSPSKTFLDQKLNVPE